MLITGFLVPSPLIVTEHREPTPSAWDSCGPSVPKKLGEAQGKQEMGETEGEVKGLRLDIGAGFQPGAWKGAKPWTPL